MGCLYFGEAVQTAKDAGDSQTAEEEESLQATSETVSEEQDAQKASEDGDESRETDDTASVEDGDEVPDAPEGEEREMPSMLDLTGDELVVSITEETHITRQIMSGDQGGPQMGEAPEKPESQETGEEPESQETGEKPESQETGEKPESQDTGEEAAGQDSTEEGQQPPDGDGPEEPDGQNAEGGKQQEELTLEDLAEGDTVSILLNEDGSAAEIAVMGGGAGGGMGGQTEAPDSYEAVNSYTEDAQETDKTVSSEGTDENAVLVSEGAEVSFSDLVVSRMSEDSEGGDAASFYGVGAALLNIDGSLYLTDSTINTDAAGGTGIFSYGEGETWVSDTEITTQKDTSGGIHVAGGGTLYAWDLDVDTSGESSAAIRSDREGGTMVVDGGSYVSNGVNSPVVYSTAQIAVNNAKLIATGSEAVCIEGLNELRLFDSDLEGNMSENEQNDCTWNVILYQSMSGDSEVGNSTFEMNGGTLTAKNVGMFYTTNTESTFILSGVDITYAEDNPFFLRCTGNSNERGWGQAGENGADCLFTAVNQEMQGDIIWDSISQLDFYLTAGSSLTGAVVQDESCAGDGGDGYSSLYLADGCSWTVTGNSTLTNLYCAGEIRDADGNSVTVQGTDGTVYVQGSSPYTITVDSYQETVDLSEAAQVTEWADYQVEKPSQLL